MSAFEENGYLRVSAMLSPLQVQSVLERLNSISADGAGTRNLLGLSWCCALARQLKESLPQYIAEGHVAVQCTYFDKSADRNWLVSPHQDLSVPVKDRLDHPQLSGWSEKEGVTFVQPPASLLEELVAVRLHLDGCGVDNGPLRVVPGSHRHGRLSESQSRELRAASAEVVCVAGAGEALLMRPLLLHASSKASAPTHRRVLHFVFGPVSPGYGLRWQYAV